MHTMQRPQRPRAYVSLALALFGLLQASCNDDAAIYTVGTEVSPEGNVVQKPLLVRLSQLRAGADAPGPRVRVDQTVHDFGRLDPLTNHQHTFVLHNVGDAPLELTEGPTTCKCTFANLPRGAVPPGGMVAVTLHWNTGRDLEYSHSATILTNDPRQQVVRLQIRGQVQVLLRCEPEQLVFSRVAPGEQPSASTLVYSRTWDAFHIDRVEPSEPGLTHVIEKATPGELEGLRATAAYRLTVTLPADMPEGYFDIPVRIAVFRDEEPADRDATNRIEADCEVLVAGKVLRRWSVYGPQVSPLGTVMMGRVLQGQTACAKVLLKLRDAQTQFTVQGIESLPEFLQVRLEPHSQGSGQDVGLYQLHVEVPADAPTFRLPPDRQGYVRITSDHPRAPVLELPVDLIVFPRSELGY